jgi:phenylacetate-CoA ligase
MGSPCIAAMTADAVRRTPLEAWIARKIGDTSGSLSPEILKVYQQQKISETLRLALKKSPFYQRKLAGFSPGIENLANLQCFPFTTAEELRAEGLQMVCVSQDEIQRVVTLDSSGTSGRPKRLYFTRSDQELTIDFFGVGMSTMAALGERVLILMPCMTPGSVGDLLAIALQQTGVIPLKNGPVQDPAQVLSRIREEQVNCLVGVPVQILALARSARAETSMPIHSLKSVLLCNDYVPQAIVNELHATWGCEVFSHYGMTEMGLGGGVSCAAQRGYHLREADLYFEIIDPHSGHVLPPGEPGEVVFTTLTRRGMPLIRYRSGDLSRFIPGDCPCGAALKTMEKIKSRLSTQIRWGEDILTPAELDEALFLLPALLNYIAGLTREKGRDCLAVEILATHESDGILEEARSALMGIMAIRKAVEAERLILRLSFRPPAPGEWGNMLKRKIIDRRG